MLWLWLGGPGLSISVGQEVIDEAALRNEDGRLLDNALVQMEATAAVNDMYNFKFEKAARQFEWFREKYPDHPLPYFLLGLNQWWQIMPNSDVDTYDETFFGYMDLTIDKARDLYQQDRENAEAAFFLAAAYAFKSRLNAERKNWTKAIFNGKSALKFLRVGRANEELSPELLLGDALYNYYSIWIPKNYPLLRPVLLLFKKGDQQLGLEQLQKVAQEAFYTRTEAQYFLVRIFRSDENRPAEALPVAEYLANTFPDNAYFQRTYASILYVLGQLDRLEMVSKQVLDKINQAYPGYEAVSGRYASYFLGYVYRLRYKNLTQAAYYYRQAVAFAEESQHQDSGYYHGALQQLAQYAVQAKDFTQARLYYQKLKDHSPKKSQYYKEANGWLKKNRPVSPKKNRQKRKKS
ncbi:MAG: hypothetical protein OHK0053_30910 [Microscillaceae bacterium]